MRRVGECARISPRYSHSENDLESSSHRDMTSLSADSSSLSGSLWLRLLLFTTLSPAHVTRSARRIPHPAGYRRLSW